MSETSKIKGAKVGDRIVSLEHFGTIKYIGEVDGHAATWFGIDWDDADRGKHNGFVNGKQYFTTRTEKSGSFVRPEKVELGQSIVTSATTRYGVKCDDERYEQQLLQTQQIINAPYLKMIGFDKVTDIQSDYARINILNVRLQNVNSAGEPSEMKKLFPNIKELDISKNLINSWSIVFQMCDEFEFLEILNVRDNILTMPENYKDFNFPNLKLLSIGSMQLTWIELLQISTVFPNLEEIIANNNNITNLDTDENYLVNLKALDLENNPIKKWSEVQKLGKLPKLELLNLQYCNIAEIRFDGEIKSEQFQTLETLFIKNNLIKDWESIGALNKLNNFNDLKIFPSPLYQLESYDTCEQLIIASIPNLQFLNGTIIKQDIRRGAEYDYLKKYGLEWLDVKDTEKRDDFLRRHNRYFELVEKHGELEESELKILSKTIVVSLVEIELIHESKMIKKKLPPSILIQKLIMLIQRLFNLSDRPNLVYTSGDIKIELDDECKELGFYSIENGDRIIVNT